MSLASEPGFGSRPAKPSSPASRPSRHAIPPAARHVRGWRYFAGLFGGEHIAATEFIIGVTFVTMGVGTREVLLGLLMGNLMAVLSWTLVTAPIAVETRRSLFAYLEQIAGPYFSRIYNLAILLFYGALAAAMITVSAYALRFALGIPVQLEWYPTSAAFVLVTLALAAVVVVVAANGFEAMANFATICAPWMLACFICGAAVALPVLAIGANGSTGFGGWAGFLDAADRTIWTGVTPAGDPGISVWEVAAFAWANGAMVHLGLIDMAIFRFARKKAYGLFSGVGMFLGHYLGWIAAGLMGAGAALLVGVPLVGLDSADVAFATLGYVGVIVVICAGWTTANACLYRAGLAASTLLPSMSRGRVTAILGVVIAIGACFPFVARSVMPLTVYGAMLLSPVGAIVLAEHYLMPRLGLTRYWSRYHGHNVNPAALLTWGLSLAFAVAAFGSGLVSFYVVFLPEYLLALLLYPALAWAMGARKSWPRREALQAEREEALEAFEERREAREAAAAQEQQAEEDPSAERTARLAKWLLGGAAVMLVTMIAMAVRLAWLTPTQETLATLRHGFQSVAMACTLCYFVLAVLAMRVTDGNEG